MVHKIRGIERGYKILHSVIDNFNKYVTPSITYTRPMTLFIWTNNNGKELIGAEIGVREGYNAKSMLRNLNIKKLFLIDPFVPYVEDGLVKVGVSVDFAKRTLKKYSKNIEILQLSSEEASQIISDSSLDFVYIDACHEPKFVRQDMNLWYQKIKKGGVLGGHDIHDSKILREFIHFFSDKDECYVLDKDWWIVKG